MALIAVRLVEGFLELQSSALELYLHQRQPVDKNGNVVAIFVTTLDSCLVGDLKLVLTPLFLVKEFYVKARAVISYQMKLVTLCLSSLKDGTFAEVI